MECRIKVDLFQIYWTFQHILVLGCVGAFYHLPFADVRYRSIGILIHVECVFHIRGHHVCVDFSGKFPLRKSLHTSGILKVCLTKVSWVSCMFGFTRVKLIL